MKRLRDKMKKYCLLFICMCMLTGNVSAMDYNKDVYNEPLKALRNAEINAFTGQYITSPDVLSIKEAYSVVNGNKTDTNNLILAVYEKGILTSVSYQFLDKITLLDMNERKKYADKLNDIIDCIYRPFTAYHNIIFKDFEEGKPVGHMPFGMAFYHEALKCLRLNGFYK